VAGLSMADQIIEKGHIAAYKIDWSGGEWTGWYISGVNDLDDYYNPEPKECSLSYRANTIRRKWAFIYDHTHMFIVCRP
jgi:hypothetical protein